jgi:hypothetical protein
MIFGDGQGRLCRADSGGSDLGQPYTAVCVPKMQDFGAPQRKFLLRARGTFRANAPLSVAMFGVADFVSSSPTEGPVSSGGPSPGFWGGGEKWGGGRKWGGASYEIAVTDWQTVNGAGFAVAPGLVFTAARSAPLKMELLSLHLHMEVGRVA